MICGTRECGVVGYSSSAKVIHSLAGNVCLGPSPYSFLRFFFFFSKLFKSASLSAHRTQQSTQPSFCIMTHKNSRGKKRQPELGQTPRRRGWACHGYVRPLFRENHRGGMIQRDDSSGKCTSPVIYLSSHTLDANASLQYPTNDPMYCKLRIRARNTDNISQTRPWEYRLSQISVDLLSPQMAPGMQKKSRTKCPSAFGTSDSSSFEKTRWRCIWNIGQVKTMENRLIHVRMMDQIFSMPVVIVGLGKVMGYSPTLSARFYLSYFFLSLVFACWILLHVMGCQWCLLKYLRRSANLIPADHGPTSVNVRHSPNLSHHHSPFAICSRTYRSVEIVISQVGPGKLSIWSSTTITGPPSRDDMQCQLLGSNDRISSSRYY